MVPARPSNHQRDGNPGRALPVAVPWPRPPTFFLHHGLSAVPKIIKNATCKFSIEFMTAGRGIRG